MSPLNRFLKSESGQDVIEYVLLCGLLAWMKLVSPQSLGGAFLISQITLFLLLIPRFWQRGIAVSYWGQHMLVPIATIGPVAPVPAPVPAAPEPAPIAPTTPATT